MKKCACLIHLNNISFSSRLLWNKLMLQKKIKLFKLLSVGMGKHLLSMAVSIYFICHQYQMQRLCPWHRPRYQVQCPHTSQGQSRRCLEHKRTAEDMIIKRHGLISNLGVLVNKWTQVPSSGCLMNICLPFSSMTRSQINHIQLNWVRPLTQLDRKVLILADVIAGIARLSTSD